MFSTPSCVSLSPSSRASSSGPISEIVVRIGWPFSPYRSQNTAGLSLIGVVGDADFLGARLEHVGMLEFVAARHADAGKIALHVGHEHRHARRGELLGDGLQRHGLAGAGRAGDQAVAVGAAEPQHLALAVCAQSEEDVVHCTLR